ncbi:hypothetical protein ACJMK2_032538, partial [Sinanodonta woodiana]
NIDETDQDKKDSVEPSFLELSIPSIGDLSNDIHVAESTEIELDPYGASTIVHIPDMNSSFDISDRNIDPVNLIEEESVHDVLTETVVLYHGITYTILEGSWQKRTRLLVSSLGYSYGIKRDNVNSTLWRCTSRSRNVKYAVTIRRQGNLFVQSYAQHTHLAVPNRQLKAQVYAKVGRAAREQLFTSALKIAEDAILESSGPDTVSLPKKALLKRVENRTRAILRPDEPRTLDFETNRYLLLNEDFINAQEFLVADIRMDGERHFLLATEYQLGLLREAKRWYMDGTFKVLGEPFRQQGQLMFFHAFIERNGAQKQFPLVFYLMSRKTKSDYLAVSHYVKDFFLSICYKNSVTFPACLFARYMLIRVKEKKQHINTLCDETTSLKIVFEGNICHLNVRHSSFSMYA